MLTNFQITNNAWVDKKFAFIFIVITVVLIHSFNELKDIRTRIKLRWTKYKLCWKIWKRTRGKEGK